ncbi:MAG: hypothetical protein ACLVKR_09170 [Lachnospiraceae bacterium]
MCRLFIRLECFRGPSVCRSAEPIVVGTAKMTFLSPIKQITAAESLGFKVILMTDKIYRMAMHTPVLPA